MFNRPKKDNKQIKSSIVAFFNERNKDELAKLANELSEEAKDFFETSISGLVGHLPDELADTSITMNKAALNQLLYSSMITGYMTKTIEDKVELERVFSGSTNESSEEESILLDSLFSRPSELN
jgi:hypothetical protein